MSNDFEWSPTDLHDIQQKHGDLPANATHAQVAEHYDRIRNVVIPPTINSSTPTMPSIPLARIVRGTAIAGGFVGALAIGASVVMAIIDAVFVFVSTNALAIGGGFVGLVVLYAMVEGKRVASGCAEPHQYQNTHTHPGGHTVIVNIGDQNKNA